MSNRSVVVNDSVEGRLEIQEVPEPIQKENEALIRVRAVSLNRGEVRKSLTYAEEGYRPGWDFAGVVEKAAPNGLGPKVGERVVGMKGSGTWSEIITVAPEAMALIPDSVSFEVASTLPVAGLTALHALKKGGMLLGKKVLITGATGGVGDYALQLAKLSGAKTYAHVRREEQISIAKNSGAEFVLVGSDLKSAAENAGSFDLIIDSVGDKVLADALAILNEGGVCVNLGVSAGSAVTIDAATFFLTGRASLYGLILFDEFKPGETASHGLTILGELLAEGKIKPLISVEEDWSKVAEVAEGLNSRKFAGKAVLIVSSK